MATLRIILFVCVLVPVLSFLVPGGEPAISVLLYTPTMAFAFAMVIILHRGRVREVATALVLVFSLLVAGSVWLFGGLKANTGTGFFIPTILAFSTLGKRSGYLVGLASALFGVFVVVAEKQGLLPPPLTEMTDLNSWIALYLTLLIAVLMMQQSETSLSSLLEDAHRSASALKEAQDDVQQREATLRSLVENAPDYIAMADRNHRMTFVNRSDRLPREKLIGASIEELIHPAQRAAMSEKLERVFENRDPQRIDFDAEVDTPPEVRHYSARLSPIILDDIVSGVTMIIEDVTIRRRAEDQVRRQRDDLEEVVADRTRALAEANRRLSDELSERERVASNLRAANQSKTAFLANVSHELRSPLNAILGFSRLLRRDAGLDAEQKRRAGIITKSGEHLLTLIDDLLDVSRIEAGDIELAAEPVQILPFLEELEDVFSLRPDVSAGQVRVVGDPGLPQLAQVDAAKLRQILMNLIANALKHAPGSDVEVAARREGQRLLFSVRDWGPGIPESDLANIFEPFHQIAPRDEDSSVDGVGLGLAICRQMVDLMGGSMSVSSDVGRGALFSFAIPYVEPERRPEGETSPRENALEPSAERHRVLVVEDSKNNADLMLAVLEPLGLDVRVARNGREGVRICEEFRPSLIWMDIQMPVLDGYEATQQIRAMNLEHQPVIIALSASAMVTDRERIIEAGCDDFMAKPFDEANLFEALHRHLGLDWQPETSGGEPRELPGVRETLTLAGERMARLPAALLDALEHATQRLDTEAMRAVIGFIGSEDRALAELLSGHVQRFRFRQILSSIEDARRAN